jgi:uncharacterized membrane protein YidH (DUF202 family)
MEVLGIILLIGAGVLLVAGLVTSGIPRSRQVARRGGGEPAGAQTMLITGLTLAVVGLLLVFVI